MSTGETKSSTLGLLEGDVLQGRYRIVRQLGKGGMGAVYEAVDQRLGITVALKGTFSGDANVRKQFEHEARLLASLQHPALPRVTDHFAEDDRDFLVMQFIAGADLAPSSTSSPAIPPQQLPWPISCRCPIYLHSQDRR